MQICDYAQKRRICRENCKYALDENSYGHFCPPRKAAKFCHPVSRSIYFLLVITTEDDLCHGPQFDVIWAIGINLMSYMRSTHQNGSKANSLHLSLHKFEICPFRNNEISQELRKRSYYPFKVDYVYH